MPTHVALLRGINLAGRNRVAMAALREVVEGLGHTDVATWVQSGNVVFTSAEADHGTLAAALEQAIGDQLGVRARVVVLSCRELGSRDEAQVVGTTLYLHTPDGFGRSELAAQLTKLAGGRTAGTARNWATVRKLLAMCDGSKDRP